MGTADMTRTGVDLRVSGAVATIALARPERLNALDDTLIRALRATARDLAQRDDVHVVVLTGSGRAFSAGADLADVASVAALPLPEQERVIGDKARSTVELAALPQLTIAAVNGPCAGAAVAWAAACDIRLGAVSAFVQTAYADRGLSGDFGTAWLLRRCIGPATTLDWLARPRRIHAEEARAAGFLQDVLDDEGFAEAVAERAAQYSAVSPAALRGIVANVRDAEHSGLEEYLPRETSRHVRAKNARAAEPSDN